MRKPWPAGGCWAKTKKQWTKLKRKSVVVEVVLVTIFSRVIIIKGIIIIIIIITHILIITDQCYWIFCGRSTFAEEAHATSNIPDLPPVHYYINQNFCNKCLLMPDKLLDRIISDVAEFTLGSMKRPLLPRRQRASINLLAPGIIFFLILAHLYIKCE